MGVGVGNMHFSVHKQHGVSGLSYVARKHLQNQSIETEAHTTSLSLASEVLDASVVSQAQFDSACEAAWTSQWYGGLSSDDKSDLRTACAGVRSV